MGTVEKWSVSCHISKQGCQSHQPFQPSKCEFLSPVGIQEEKAMAPHSSTLAWKIPWMEEPGGLQSMGSLRVGHDWVTSLSLFPFMHWRRKWQPTPVFLPGESQGWGSQGTAVYGVAQSWTQLKRLSSPSSSSSIVTNRTFPGISAGIPSND